MELVVIATTLLLATAAAIGFKQRRIIELSTIVASALFVAMAATIALKVAVNGSYQVGDFSFVDPLSSIVLLTISVVAVFTAWYSGPHLQREVEKGFIGTRRVRQYFVLFNVFVLAMVLSVTAGHPVLSWIFLEATTLATAFLISFYNKASTIEAAWKYLIINSVGLLVGFLGTLLYFTAVQHGAEGLVSWRTLLDSASHFSPEVIKAAFIFVLIGYGTKVGLAPMHTWKPDAYSKAPAPIGGLLSAALMPVAFVAILKFKAVTDIAVGPQFSSQLLIVFGLASVLIAAVSMLTVKNYKRLLAYSSVEHAGLMAIGFGFGGLGAFAALLHMVYHSLIKSALFMAAGNFMIKFHSAKIEHVRGALAASPWTATIFFMGILAVAGLPPFGLFMSELLSMASGANNYLVVVVLTILALALAFLGLFKHTNSMVMGKKPATIGSGEGSIWLIAPPLGLLAIALGLSLFVPDFLQILIHAAARY